MIYPNSVPEFRLLKSLDGEIRMQVRYISHQNGYTGKWQEIPVVEEVMQNETTTSTS